MYMKSELQHDISIIHCVGDNYKLSHHWYLSKEGIDYQGSSIVRGSIEAIARYLETEGFSAKHSDITFVGISRDEFLNLLY